MAALQAAGHKGRVYDRESPEDLVLSEFSKPSKPLYIDDIYMNMYVYNTLIDTVYIYMIYDIVVCVYI